MSERVVKGVDQPTDEGLQRQAASAVPEDMESLRTRLGAAEQQRDEYLIGDDLNGIFTSPRDNQKFVVQYNLRLDPGGPTRAVAWEAEGKNGKRFVALSVGYVEEYDDETFQQYRK